MTSPTITVTRRTATAASGILVLVGSAIGALTTIAVLAGPEGVEVEDEFTATVTAIIDRSVCVDRRAGGANCAIPVQVDPRDPVEVGDEVTVTTMWLTDADGVRTEAWFVR